MSSNRKKSKSKNTGRFKKLLGWTVLLALVFSAGLITGERLVRKKSFEPLVSVSSRAEAKTPIEDNAEENAKEDDDQSGEQAPGDSKYSFFDNLTNGSQPIIKRRGEDNTRSKSAKNDAQPREQVPSQKTDSPSSAESEEADETLSAKYTLQIAAHPDMDSAKKHMDRLRKMGLDPHVISAAIPDKGKFYRVRVGKFHSMEEARRFQADLKRKNSLNTFVSPL